MNNLVGPSLLARLGSRIVRSYLRWSPIERGKYRLRDFAGSRFLVSRLEAGPWIRVSGVSDYEWAHLERAVRDERTHEAFVGLLKPGMTVFDVGANIGYYALTAAALVGESGHVHAFEPTPVVAARLSENVALNHLRNVEVNAVAVSDRVGSLAFHLSNGDSEGNSAVAFDAGWDTVEVPATTLDHYCADKGLHGVDVMKIDVEGAEALVVRGAANLLGDREGPVLIMEFNPPLLQAAGTSTDELRGLLEYSGYACYILEQLTQDNRPVFNVLAAKPAHREKFPTLDSLNLPSFAG